MMPLAAVLTALIVGMPAAAIDPEINPDSGGSAITIGGENPSSPVVPGSASPVGGNGGSINDNSVVTEETVCSVGGAQVCLEPLLCGNGVPMIRYTQSLDGTIIATWDNCGGSVPEVGTTPEPQVTPGMVVRAFERIPLPESELNIQPPNGRTLVNFDTNFFTESQDLDESVTLVGQQVDLRIWADSWTWEFGDGESLTTSETGTPFPRLTLTHRYLTAEQVDVALDTVYAADYRVNGGPWAPVPGTVTIEGTPEGLEVVEARPRLVG